VEGYTCGGDSWSGLSRASGLRRGASDSGTFTRCIGRRRVTLQLANALRHGSGRRFARQKTEACAPSWVRRQFVGGRQRARPGCMPVPGDDLTRAHWRWQMCRWKWQVRSRWP